MDIAIAIDAQEDLIRELNRKEECQLFVQEAQEVLDFLLALNEIAQKSKALADLIRTR